MNAANPRDDRNRAPMDPPHGREAHRAAPARRMASNASIGSIGSSAERASDLCRLIDRGHPASHQATALILGECNQVPSTEWARP
jgi:hypothetical protein